MREARLGDVVVSMKNGLYKPATAYADDGAPCLRMYNIDAGSIVWRDIKRMRVSAAELEEYGLQEGDLLVNRVNSRELVGKAAYIPSSIEPSVFESKNIRVRLDGSKALPKFVNYQLLAGGRRHFSGNAQQVVGMASISQKQLADFPIVLTDLDEQRRIVAEIEMQFSRLDEAVANLKRVRANLKRYKAGVLNAAVEGRLVSTEAELARRDGRGFTKGADLLACRRGPVSFGQRRHTRSSDSTHGLRIVDPALLPEGWAPATVGQVAELVTDGDHNPPKRVSVGVPHLTAKHVRDWRFETSDCTFISPEDAERAFKRYRPAPGDVIVTCVGTVGRTAVVSPDLQFSADRNLAAIRLAPETVVPQFLQIVLESPPYQRIIRSASGSTAQPHLYLRDLRALTIPVPPHAEQLRIVNEVERLRSLWEALQRQLEAATQRSEQTRKAILSRLYAG